LEDNLGACGTLVGSWNSSRWESGWRTRFFLYDGHDAHAVDIDVLWAGRTFGTFPCPRYAIGVFVNLSRLLSDPTGRPPGEMISLRPDLPDEFCPHRLALGLSHKGWSPVCCYLVSARISTYERLAGYDLGFSFRHDCVYGLEVGLEDRYHVCRVGLLVVFCEDLPGVQPTSSHCGHTRPWLRRES
jgi:hypothetical protein